MVLCHVVSFLCRDTSSPRPTAASKHLCDRCGLGCFAREHQCAQSALVLASHFAS